MRKLLYYLIHAGSNGDFYEQLNLYVLNAEQLLKITKKQVQ